MAERSTPDELALFNDISARAASLWAKSQAVIGRSDDPKMFSIMLFKRLWSNHRGYAVLWNNALQTESDIVLRSGIEASICIAANFQLRGEFVHLMHGDAIATLKGQIKLHRSEGNCDFVRHAEAVMRDLYSRFPPHRKPVKLDWSYLAEKGGVPQLYGWHRMLSGLSSHVTGASVLTAIAPAEGPNPAAELPPLQRKMHLMMMAAATLQASLRHAGMLDDATQVEATVALIERMNVVSSAFPGAELRI